MNVEIGAEATLFPEKEYINGIFVTVRDPQCISSSTVDMHCAKFYVCITLLVEQ